MITLRKNEYLRVLLGEDPTTEAPIVCTFDEMQGGRTASKTTDTISNATSVVDVVAGIATIRKITGFSIHNADGSAITVTIRFTNAAGTNRTIHKCTLQTLETLHWSPSQGWYAVDVNGNLKQAASTTSSATSEALSAGVSAGTRASTTLSTATSADTSLSTVGSTTLSTATSGDTSLSVVASTNKSIQASGDTSLSTNLSVVKSTADSG